MELPDLAMSEITKRIQSFYSRLTLHASRLTIFNEKLSFSYLLSIYPITSIQAPH